MSGATSETRGPLARERALLLSLALAITALLAFVTLAPRLLGKARVPLERAERRPLGGHGFTVELPARSLARLPEETTIEEDGVPLARPYATEADIASLGSGRYCVWAGRVVHASSSDGTDPLANGRRYEVVFDPPAMNALGSRPGLALAGLVLALALVAARTGVLRLRGVSSPRARLALALATLVVLGAGLSRHWDRLFVWPDSSSYIRHAATRPLLYPAFVDLFDREPAAPRKPLVPEAFAPVIEPAHRYLGVVHAQKVVTALALALLALVLSGAVNAWLAGALLALGAMIDLLRAGDGSLAFNVDCLLSEGLNHALVLLLTTAVLAYLLRPGWSRGTALALVLALLLLNRPANLAFAGVFLLLFLFHLAEDGLRRALARTAGLALLYLLPILVACGATYRTNGHFQLHSFTGFSLIGTALSIATPADVDALEEPEAREILRLSVVDFAPRRLDPWKDDSELVVNGNIYGIAYPAFSQACQHPARTEDLHCTHADDVFLAIGWHLVTRHPLDFAALALLRLGHVFSLTVHGVLAVVVVAAVSLYVRSRRPELLFVVFVALAPVVAIIPACVANYPIERYRSQLYFAEVVALPLLLALLATHGGTALAAPWKVGAAAGRTMPP